MTPATRDDGIFATSRQFPFPASQLRDAFAHADRLARWWGPDGFSNHIEVFEFWPQGRWTFVMQGPDGQRYPNACLFLETGPQRIVIRHTVAPLFTLTVSLAETDGRTLLHWQQAFDDPAVAAAVAHIVVPANEQNLNRLQALLDSGG
ncbi:MAG: polyketide cyclase [Burkholderiales bacterium PBB5]|nr:MAG: polyketide cyclase [Burkholderiales bacterium PBB5]